METTLLEKLEYMDDETLLSVSRIAKLVGVSTETVRRWIRNGYLKPYAPTSHYKIPVYELKIFLKRKYNGKSKKVQLS